MPILAVLFGVLISWIVCSRIIPDDGTVPYMAVAIIISAFVGGLIVWLPKGMPGAGNKPGARILLLLCGSMAVAVIYALIRAIIPYTKQNPGTMAAWALLAVAVVTVLTGLRRSGLPLLLGGIVMAVTIAVAGVGDTGLGTLMQIAIIPSFLAGLLALLAYRITYLIRDPDKQATPKEPELPEQELTGVGS